MRIKDMALWDIDITDWFQTLFIFHNVWDNPSHWLSHVSEGLKLETTNQIMMIVFQYYHCCLWSWHHRPAPFRITSWSSQSLDPSPSVQLGGPPEALEKSQLSIGKSIKSSIDRLFQSIVPKFSIWDYMTSYDQVIDSQTIINESHL